jgi:Mg-chelatase subunit ChlD
MRALLLLFLAHTAVAAPQLTAPPTASIGQEIAIAVAGSKNPKDFVTVVEKGATEGTYRGYVYVESATRVTLAMPTSPGEYELRLCAADFPYATLARSVIRVGAASASVQGPDRVAPGVQFSVQWSGPANSADYIGIGAVGANAAPYLSWAYTRKGNPATLIAPEKPGDYELRYFLGEGDTIIARRKITVGAATGSIQAPSEAVAGSAIAVKWQGPNNPQNYITIVAQGAADGEYGHYAYTSKANPVQLVAPITPGAYEIRYYTSLSDFVIARAPIRITPGKQEPGRVAVSAAKANANNAVVIILDASGSMLQRIGNQRRIDLAKQTLTTLTTKALPPGTPFALRVFGREVDSCQTNLEIPLGPLDAASAAQRIAKLEAKNNAKTPIGASLAKVAGDFGTTPGERVVVLLTDGEETCGGDPAAEIAKLRQGGVRVRVSIVGFAIDNKALAGTFGRWADAGGGTYFDAKDGSALTTAMQAALRPVYELVAADGRVVAEGIVGGDPVSVMPGSYTLRRKGHPSPGAAITVKPGETTQATL